MSSKKTYDSVSETVEVETKVETNPATHTVKDGDTWASISDTHRPTGTTIHKYAEQLLATNGGILTPGRTIKL